MVAGTGVGFAYTSDTSEAEKGMQKLIEKNDQILASIRKTAEANAKAREEAKKDREARAAAAKAERAENKERERAVAITREFETAQQRFARRKAEVVKLTRQGKMSIEDAKQAMTALKAEYAATTEEGKRLAQAERDKDAAIRRGSRIVESTQGPLRRYRQDMQDLRAAHKAGTISTKQFADAQTELKSRARSALSGQGDKVQAVTSRVMGMASAYVGVQQAISATTRALEEHIEMQKESQEFSSRIGGAQQETIKNLTGLSADQIKQALSTAKQLQKDLKFPDLEQLVLAVGKGFSAGGDIEQTIEAVRESAAITINKPEDLSAVSSSVIDVRRALGGKTTAKEALSFLLSAGATARVEDPVKLARALGPVLQSGRDLNPNQDPVEAAKDAAALFGVLSRSAVDFKGESTATAGITLIQQMDKFFDGLGESRAELQGKIAKLEKEDAVTEDEQFRIDDTRRKLRNKQQEISKFGTAKPGSARAAELEELQFEERGLKVALASAIRNSTLDADNKSKLLTMRQQLVQMNALKDSGTIRGRFSALSASPLLAEFFANEFGERRFQAGFKAVFQQGGALAAEMEKSREQIKADPNIVKQKIDQVQAINETQAASTAQARGKALREQLADSSDEAFVGAIRDKYFDTLKRTRPGGLDDVLLSAGEGISYLGSTTHDPIEQARAARRGLSDRLGILSYGGELSEADYRRLTQSRSKISSALEAIADDLESFLRTHQDLSGQQQDEGQQVIQNLRAEADAAAARVAAAAAGN